MGPVRRAVIDVGTNSVKLLVADVSGREVVPLLEESKQTRLGQGFYSTHQLQPQAISLTASAVARFAAKAREHLAVSIRGIATSAAGVRSIPRLWVQLSNRLAACRWKSFQATRKRTGYFAA